MMHYFYCLIFFLLQDGLQPIHIAARSGHLNIIDTIIDKYKISPDSKVIIIIAMNLFASNYLNFIHQAGDGSQSIHYAAEQGHPRIVKSLITKHGVNPQCQKVRCFEPFTVCCHS